MIVVDASLVAKFFVTEADSAAADRWYLEAPRHILSPDLIAIEVSQSIVRRVNARDMTRADGEHALRLWSAMQAGGGIRLIRSEPEQVAAAALLALDLGHPVKDCLYLALAMDRNAELVTCDAKFARKAQSIHPAVRTLADYG